MRIYVWDCEWGEPTCPQDCYREFTPNIEAAAVPVAVALADAVSLVTGQAVALDFIDDEMKTIAKAVVAAALTPGGDDD